MSCAGCDDCPLDAWHLHVTVGELKNAWWTDGEWSTVVDLITPYVRPLTIFNHFWGDRPFYTERIPTLNFKGTEMEAVDQLFRLGMTLIQRGFHVKRLKLEGDATRVPSGRALYYEAHVKPDPASEIHLRAAEMKIPWSMNARGQTIFTVRHPYARVVNDRAAYLVGQDMTLPRIEACVLDTNEQLDHDWMNQ